MTEYFLTLQLDAQRTMDIRVEAPCAYDARQRYKQSGGKHRIIAIRPCQKTPEDADSQG
jgi:hypothetical protein